MWKMQPAETDVESSLLLTRVDSVSEFLLYCYFLTLSRRRYICPHCYATHSGLAVGKGGFLLSSLGNALTTRRLWSG